MIDPVVFRIGFIQVTWYALIYVIGFIVGTLVLLRAARKKEINMTSHEVYDFIILMIIGMLIGARAFHILFWDLEYFVANPMETFRIWNGGVSFHGGLLGMLIVALLYTKKKNISFLKLADLAILPATFFMVLARIANFINQEILGTITASSWCVTYPEVLGCRHPVQLYAAAGKLALFFFLVYLKKSLKNFKPGFIFVTFIVLIGIGRFFLDFIREDIHYLALSAGQWFSLIMIIIGVYVLVKYYKEDTKKVIN